MTELVAPHPMTTAPHLTGLNPEQRDAVETLDGPLLVLAGAGTGKTRALTTRLAHLLHSKKCFAGEILAVTFTNKAAAEMKERVANLLGQPVDGLWLGTFHSIAARILRRHAEIVGLRPDFTIIDMDDQIRLLKAICVESGLDEKRWPAKVISSLIQRWKDKGLTPEKVAGESEADYAEGRLPELYATYQARLKQLSAADFGDLLMHNLTIFLQHPDIVQDYANRFKYILVDEYQDTNSAQYLWLRLLASAHKNICCVGDDDQSIYGWRGAEVGHILKFEHDFPDAKIIRLERNYRSTEHILGAASSIIANNEERLGKTLFTDQEGGEKIRLWHCWDDREEARAIADDIESLQLKGTNLDEMAVLVRASFQTRQFEEQFMQMGTPYRVVGGLRFYERKEIRDMIAYLRIIQQPLDDLAFERIVNTPKRGVGKSTMDRLIAQSRQRFAALHDIVNEQLANGEITGVAKGGLSRFMQQLAHWRELNQNLTPRELLGHIVEESGYEAMLKADSSPEANGRLENIRELQAAMGEFDSIVSFLEHVGLVMERESTDEHTPMVTLMTLHASKGLEFTHVYLPGWEEGLFPHQRALDETGKKGLEEERRLAYVGITRARQHLTISHASNRRIYNQWQNSIPSRFVGELPPQHLEEDAMQSRQSRMTKDRINAEIGAILEEFNQKPARKNTSNIKSNQSSEFPAGTRVTHSKFGDGRVLGSEGDKLQICFDTAGIKKLMKDYVRRA